MPSSALSTLVAGLILMTALPAIHRADTEPEDQLKAAVVLSFLRYGEWPQPPVGNAPIHIGVLGRPSFVQILRRTLEGKSVNDHPIRVQELKTVADAAGCQVVYFATDNSSEVRQELTATQLMRALTIGEAKDFLEWGGAVNLLIVDGHMGFEASLEALNRSGVVISSKLLRFGHIRKLKNGVRS